MNNTREWLNALEPTMELHPEKWRAVHTSSGNSWGVVTDDGAVIVTGTTSEAVARQIVKEHNAAHVMAAALTAVLDLHYSNDADLCRVCAEADDAAYALTWPCPTVVTITEVIGNAR